MIQPLESESGVTITRATGTATCSRCGKHIKNVFMAAGLPYGPICIKKMFGKTDKAGVVSHTKSDVSADQFPIPEEFLQ